MYTGLWCKILPLKLGLRLTLGNTCLRQDSRNAEPGCLVTESIKFNCFGSHVAMQRRHRRHVCRLVRLKHCTALYKPGNELTAVVFCVRQGLMSERGVVHFGWKRTHCCQPVASKAECSLMDSSLSPRNGRPRSWGLSLLSSWSLPHFYTLLCSK